MPEVPDRNLEQELTVVNTQRITCHIPTALRKTLCCSHTFKQCGTHLFLITRQTWFIVEECQGVGMTFNELCKPLGATQNTQKPGSCPFVTEKFLHRFKGSFRLTQSQ